METLLKDIRFGWRMLVKHPGTTAVAVITLALGIGANTAIFSIVNAVLLRPLPYKDPDRLVSLWANVPVHGRWRVTPANFFDLKKQSTVFDDVAAFGAATMTLTGDGEPEQLLGARAGAGYFRVVGVEPELGRSFLPEEYEPGRDQVVILGHDFWQRRYGGNPQIINRSIRLDGTSYTVVGVMPPGIYPAWPTTSGHISFDSKQQQFWMPYAFPAAWASVRTAHVLGALGRLKAGVSIEAAQTEMNMIAARLEQEYPVNKGEGIIVSPFMNEVVGDSKPALLTLFAAVGFVLLIACANIAGLLLAQHAARSKEVAIRAALGASRRRLVRQFFIEALLLSVLGTIAGTALASFAVQAVLMTTLSQVPRLDETRLDISVLAFTLLLSAVTCLLCGVIPAWRATKADLYVTLEQGGRSGSAGGRQRLRELLVVLQVATAVVLVIGAGLLIKSFWRLRQVDPGFKPDHLLTLSITLPYSKYGDNQKVNSFYAQLIERISALPGVTSTAIGYDHPLQTNWVDEFSIEGRPTSPGESTSANFNPVSWDYFHTVGTQVIAGRQFTSQDDQDHPGVAIINETFARRYFPDGRALGQRLGLGPPARIWRGQKFTSFEIIGIARDVKSSGLNATSEPIYYVPASQAPLQDMTILVRSSVDPVTLTPGLRNVVWSIDKDQPIANIETMEKVISDSIAQPRLNSLLMALFGGLALILATVGIYGLLSYAVARRTHEIGIRMAVGAEIRDVLKLILRQGMKLVVIGEVIGLVAAFILARLIRTLLFGVTPADTATFAFVVAVFTVTAVIACYFPARRATRIDPLVALRYE